MEQKIIENTFQTVEEKIEYLKNNVENTREYISFLIEFATKQNWLPLKKFFTREKWNEISVALNNARRNIQTKKNYDTNLEFKRFLTALKKEDGVNVVLNAVSDKVFNDWFKDLKAISKELQVETHDIKDKARRTYNVLMDLEVLNIESKIADKILDVAQRNIDKKTNKTAERKL